MTYTYVLLLMDCRLQYILHLVIMRVRVSGSEQDRVGCMHRMTYTYMLTNGLQTAVHTAPGDNEGQSRTKEDSAYEA
jgi:hypothetical protein